MNDLYDFKKAKLISEFSKLELNGSGWVLSKTIKLQVFITDYTPLLNVNAEPQAPLNNNDNDRGGNCLFDIGDYFRNKKAIIVPQNKNDSFYFLWACSIAKFKPEKNASRFFEQGIRGGYSIIHKQYSKANHKYLPSFDPNEESKFLKYWDMNSYPSVMVEPMPVRDFRWGTQSEIDSILEVCKEGEQSDGSKTLYDEIPPCTLSVDLKHNPKNFEKEKVFAMCPDFYEDIGVKKLTHNLFDKKDYVVHHRTLKKYLSERMILDKVNKIVLYTEEAWMKEYIEFCVQKRKEAELAGNDFYVSFWKLMTNSVFGKTMENIRKKKI